MPRLTALSHGEHPLFDMSEESKGGLEAVVLPSLLGCGGEERRPLLSDERVVAGPQGCDVDPDAPPVLGGVAALDQAPGLQAAQQSGLAILPMVVLFFVGSVVSPHLLSRFGRGAMAAGGSVQAIGLALIIAVILRAWPHVTMLDLAGPLALIGAGQALLFAGLFRIVLTDVPAHHGGIGSGVLVTLQQTGLALGVATLGTLYVALAPQGISRAFGAAIGIQFAIAVLLVFVSRSLPRFTAAPPNEVEASI